MPTNAGRPVLEEVKLTLEAQTFSSPVEDTFYEVEFDTIAYDTDNSLNGSVPSFGVPVIKNRFYRVRVYFAAVDASAATPTMNVRLAISDDTAQGSFDNQALSTTPATYGEFELVFQATKSGTLQLQVANDTGTEDIVLATNNYMIVETLS
jgi:hypothetical protein